MMSYLIGVVLTILGFLAGIAIGVLVRRYWLERRSAKFHERAAGILNEAHKEVEALKKEAILQAKDTLFQMKTEFEKETKETKKELQSLEKRLLQKEENLDKKSEMLDKRENNIGRREKNILQQENDISEKNKSLQALIEEQRLKLESLSGISSQEAKDMLISSIENEARHEAAMLVKKIETEARETADKKAKDIISSAVQRYAGDYVAEKTVSVVNLPNEEMKGRIIGREGRNIRAIEASTGIDLIIDDTPEAVILSGFNPIRREVARISLERLISDGRIHPARIEEMVEKVGVEIENTHTRSRRAGGVRHRSPWYQPRTHQIAGKAQVSNELCAERAATLH